MNRPNRLPSLRPNMLCSMTMPVNPYSLSGAVVLHAVSAARGQSSPVEVARQPYRLPESVVLILGRASKVFSARWASLGCDATRRQQLNIALMRSCGGAGRDAAATEKNGPSSPPYLNVNSAGLARLARARLKR